VYRLYFRIGRATGIKFGEKIVNSLALPMHFRFQDTYSFISKPKRLKLDWGRKSRPNFELFTVCKNSERVERNV